MQSKPASKPSEQLSVFQLDNTWKAVHVGSAGAGFVDVVKLKLLTNKDGEFNNLYYSIRTSLVATVPTIEDRASRNENREYEIAVDDTYVLFLRTDRTTIITCYIDSSNLH